MINLMMMNTIIMIEMEKEMDMINHYQYFQELLLNYLLLRQLPMFCFIVWKVTFPMGINTSPIKNNIDSIFNLEFEKLVEKGFYK